MNGTLLRPIELVGIKVPILINTLLGRNFIVINNNSN